MPEPAYPEKRLSFWTQGESEDTHHWLPCYDYPNDRATTEMIITVEKPLFVRLERVAGRDQGQRRTTPRPITGRWTCPTSAT